MHHKPTHHETTSKKQIRVNLTQQVVETYDGSERVHRFECISGDTDHRTDKGLFKIWDKRHPYTSHAYHVPMNYALFFTQDGKALHQYHGPAFNAVRMFKKSISDWFGSHGCVRLKEEDAKTLFGWAQKGTTVYVF
ncbi:L,D-transpeptidase [Massilia horti]|uniref:Murein L,D-transpeptidase n=1 Tax=Massilia horti TaxID=2562153 RepID=A0A4Y9T5Y5_9BURK|nr:L,D-transpeptidase [Massilia horti]TFW35779.1 murein L,D-transpeptidase [Massilia horti]